MRLTMKWQQLHPTLYLYPDSCNVYAIVGPEGVLVVDAGTGAWLDHLDELPAPVTALTCTHFFRDHAAGAARAAAQGIPVYVPAGEAAIFADPQQHFRQRDTYIIYDNYWDLFAPIEAVAVAGLLEDYARIRLCGIDLEVVPLPGVTVTPQPTDPLTETALPFTATVQPSNTPVPNTPTVAPTVTAIPTLTVSPTAFPNP